MNGGYGNNGDKNQIKESSDKIEYDFLKQGGNYNYNLNLKRTQYDNYFDANDVMNGRGENAPLYENYNNISYRKNLNYYEHEEYVDNRKHSYLMSELLREENSKGLEELLIESYHDIGVLDLKRICEISLKLGCISFGGPLAHQELIRSKFVQENKIMTEKHFRKILNLCLVLPGYSSSTLLAALVTVKTQSILYGVLSLTLFNIPSLIAVLVFSLLIKTIKQEIHSNISNFKPDVAYFNIYEDPFYFVIMIISTGIIQAALGLMIHSAYVLGKKLSYSGFQFTLLVGSGIIYYMVPNYNLMVIIIIICGLFSSIKGDHDYLLDHSDVIGFDEKISKIKFIGLPCLIFFFGIYALIYMFNFFTKNLYFFLFESFFRIGALSFGEGHVIIPMILTEFTNKKLIEEAEVLNGYALVSLLPGSMFNMAAYSGVICQNIIGGIISNVAIFLPGLLFVYAALPYMDKIKSSNFLQFFIRGANSAAIGFVFTAAVKLWIDSCFVNPYTNPVVGTLNILICYILVEAFKVHKPYVIAFGASFILLLTYTKSFLSTQD